nr:hypothetical protein HK105_000375 [Polyrhizophydium stewartii]
MSATADCSVLSTAFPSLALPANCCTNPRVTCTNGRITGLELSSSGLSGPMPQALSQLNVLRVLSVFNNSFTGPIPSWFGDMTSLSSLYLGLNSFSGTVPDSLGKLTGLQTLALGQNNLAMPLPESLGNLQGLSYLGLNGLPFWRPIPDWVGKLTSLTFLNLGSSSFNGTIPEWLGNLKSLESLYLDTNDFSGTIPASFSQISNITTLHVYNNPRLTGELPATIYSQGSCLASGTKLCSNSTNIQTLCKLSAFASTNSGLSGGAIGGIVAGVVVVIAAVAAFVWFRTRGQNNKPLLPSEQPMIGREPVSSIATSPSYVSRSGSPSLASSSAYQDAGNGSARLVESIVTAPAGPNGNKAVLVERAPVPGDGSDLSNNKLNGSLPRLQGLSKLSQM